LNLPAANGPACRSTGGSDIPACRQAGVRWLGRTFVYFGQITKDDKNYK